MQSEESEITQEVLIRNGRDKKIEVVLEPLGEVVDLVPSEEYSVRMICQKGKFISITLEESKIILFTEDPRDLSFIKKKDDRP